MERTGRMMIAAVSLAGLTGASGGDHLIAAAPSLVPMAPCTVPIADGGRLLGTLSVSLVLDAGDEEKAVLLEPEAPVLRSAALTLLSDVAVAEASPTEPVDGERLAKRLTEALHRANPAVERVLIVELSARNG